MDEQQELKAARQWMIDEHLKRRGIKSSRVVTAMAHVPRQRFVSEPLKRDAYADRALAIDCGQTISQPFIVALMTEALQLSGSEHVLEVGTGSGYQTAVLAELAGDVVSIERYEALSRQAADRLGELGYRNVRLIVGDGTLGWPDDAPYDRVIVTAAAPRCQPALFDQLRETGILIAPIGDDTDQNLITIRKLGGRPQFAQLTGCRFVPLIASPEDQA